MRNRLIVTTGGFTLIELMVVLSIFSVVMSMAFSALSINETYRDLVYIKNQLYRQNKKAHDIITEELAKSQPSSVTINGTTAIRFQVPWINGSDPEYGVVWGARYNGIPYPGYYINYRLINGTNNSTNLVREVLTDTLSPVAGTQEVKATGIVNLRFSNLTANYDYININTTARQISQPSQRPFNLSLSSNVSLQN